MLVHPGGHSSGRRIFPTSTLPVMAAFAVALAGSVLFWRFAALSTPVPTFAPVRAPNFGALPLAFEPNAGQADPSVYYLARAQGASLFFSQSGVALSSADSEADAPDLSLHFIDADPSTTLQSGTLLTGRTNYLLGNDPAKWHTNLPNYADITYSNLYKGIDLSYTGHAGTLKGTYSLAPGADPTRIRWRYDGASQVNLDAAGNLQITVQRPAENPKSKIQNPKLIEQAPVAWQEINGKRVHVSASYKPGTDGTIGFILGNYDRAYSLTIDPVLSYSTYLGGSADDEGKSIAVNSAGEVFVTGYTQSNNFPTSNARQPNNAGGSDVFITKFDSTGRTLLYSTYLGGSGNDEAHGIALDGAGNAYLTGKTASPNFPTTPNAYQPGFRGAVEVFVTKLSADGATLVYSTYLSGTSNEEANGIAVDSSNNIYVTGFTTSANFPIANAYQPAIHSAQDAFITKFNAAGTALVYSTFFGGSIGLGGNYDEGFGIAADAAGNAYVTGLTGSTDFPTVNPIQPTNHGNFDAFAAKFDATGGVVYSTYLGGSSLDEGHGIAVDTSGQAYLAGQAGSTDFPIVNAFQPTSHGFGDAFITKISPDGSALIYSTYLGGSSYDYGFGIALDPSRNVYVIGQTGSTDFPTANPIQPQLAGPFDVSVSSLSSSGQFLNYSTYLGGNSYEHGYGIAVDAEGAAYVTGDTYSEDFPTANPYQPNIASHIDAFVSKISLTSNATPTLTPTVRPTNTPAPPTATFTPLPCDINFIDVQPSDYFYEAVRYLYCMGVLRGYDDGYFRPYNNTTRGQLSKIIVLAQGREVDCPDTGHFTDVPPDQVFYCYIETAYEHGIITGHDDGTFRPDNFVTRGQLSKIIVLAMGWTDPCPSNGHFTDVPVGSPFFCFIETAFAHSIINGYADGTFRPDNNATRGQISKIVYEAITAPRTINYRN